MESIQHTATIRTEDAELTHMSFDILSRFGMFHALLTEEVGESPPVIPRTGDLTGGEKEPGHHWWPST